LIDCRSLKFASHIVTLIAVNENFINLHLTERKKRNAMKRMKRSEMPIKQAECQTAKRIHREAVVRKEVLLVFDTLLANFRNSKFFNIIESPLGIEAEILRRRLQCKA